MKNNRREIMIMIFLAAISISVSAIQATDHVNEIERLKTELANEQISNKELRDKLADALLKAAHKHPPMTATEALMLLPAVVK